MYFSCLNNSLRNISLSEGGGARGLSIAHHKADVSPDVLLDLKGDAQVKAVTVSTSNTQTGLSRE